MSENENESYHCDVSSPKLRCKVKRTFKANKAMPKAKRKSK